jgi:hypothetical protein
LLSYAKAVEQMDLGESSDTSVSYIGYARKLAIDDPGAPGGLLAPSAADSHAVRRTLDL